LKGLHREKQAEDRQQQHAKNEVARLAGLVPRTASSATTSKDSRAGATPTFTKPQEKQATLEDRKRQIEQLAAMGVAVPDQMRGEMALAGDWQVVSERVIDEEGKEVKLNTGVRKRKLNEEEQEQIEAGEMITKKRGWGKTFKSFPGKMGAIDDDDLDALLGPKKPASRQEADKDPKVKSEADVKDEPDVKEEPNVKDEGSPSLQDIPTEEEATKQSEATQATAPAVVFKKRKKIAR
jgi:hypothetical protein